MQVISQLVNLFAFTFDATFDEPFQRLILNGLKNHLQENILTRLEASAISLARMNSSRNNGQYLYYQGEKRLAATKGSNDLIYNRLQFSMTPGPL